MNVEKNYSRAVKQYKSKNYNDALKILDKIKRYAPSFRRTYMLEVDIYKELNNYVKEIDAAEKVLSMFNLNDPKEKYLATNAFWFLGHALSQLSLNEEAVKNFRTAAKYATENNSALKALQSAIYVGCYTECFSAADMRALYDEYKKYLPNIIPPPPTAYILRPQENSYRIFIGRFLQTSRTSLVLGIVYQSGQKSFRGVLLFQHGNSGRAYGTFAFHSLHLA